MGLQVIAKFKSVTSKVLQSNYNKMAYTNLLTFPEICWGIANT